MIMLSLQHQAVSYTLVDMVGINMKQLIGLLNIRTWNGLYLVILLAHDMVIAQSKWRTRFIFLAELTQRKILSFLFGQMLNIIALAILKSGRILEIRPIQTIKESY